MSMKKSLSVLALSILFAGSINPAFALNRVIIDDGNGSSYPSAPAPAPIRPVCTYTTAPADCALADFDNDCDVDMGDVNIALDEFRNTARPIDYDVDINIICIDQSGNISSLGDEHEDFRDIDLVGRCRNLGWTRQGCTKPSKVVDSVQAVSNDLFETSAALAKANKKLKLKQKSAPAPTNNGRRAQP